jgi:hypothetical protein
MNNRDVAAEFVNGATSGEGSHMYIRGSVLYSYGEHFPLAFRGQDGKLYYNGERYSNSTSKQQSHFRMVARNFIEVNTEIIKKLIVQGVREVLFESYHHTKSMKALVAALQEAGFTAVDNNWYTVKYGDMRIVVCWNHWWHKPDSKSDFISGLSAEIYGEGNTNLGFIAASKGKLVKNELNIAAVLV